MMEKGFPVDQLPLAQVAKEGVLINLPHKGPNSSISVKDILDTGVQLGPGMFVDPSTGLTQVSLPDDAIDSVAVLANPYAVEYGRFSSGLVVIQTRLS